MIPITVNRRWLDNKMQHYPFDWDELMESGEIIGSILVHKPNGCVAGEETVVARTIDLHGKQLIKWIHVDTYINSCMLYTKEEFIKKCKSLNVNFLISFRRD